MKKIPPSPHDLACFRKATERIVPIPDTEWEYGVKSISRQEYEKSEFLIQAGDQVDNLFFIVSGLVRFFYHTETGKEYNKHFAAESQYAGSYLSMIKKIPCPYSVQTLEPTEVLVLPNLLLQDLFNHHQAWERLGRLHAEQLAMLKELREKELLLDSATTRYRRFLSEFPGLAGRIPQYHIASYLGITDVALSRIRKKMDTLNPG
ncbi:Crp/Fnr family transcriptional regulator [Thermodesulfobacteriota bacterium]